MDVIGALAGSTAPTLPSSARSRFGAEIDRPFSITVINGGLMTEGTQGRRYFLRQMAQTAGLLSATRLSVTRLFAQEPNNCAGPPSPATAVKWTPSTESILPRLSASTLSASDAAKLRKAYVALRQLAIDHPGDPRGWMQQGNKHCWNCGGGLDGQSGEEIHGSWLFFPWHRAFLYFHERILGAVSNDPSIRLSYWDWDNSANTAVPAAWVTPGTNMNPLWDKNRSVVQTDQLPGNLVGAPVLNQVMGSPTFADFLGTANTPGSMENGPHGAVHLWCGDKTNLNPTADMGVLDTAAQDPIFFAHHANIDRLWEVWLASSATHKNPTDASWLSHRFTFWDETKKWVYITVADVINMSANLRYTYGDASTPAVTFGAASKVKLTIGANQAVILPDTIRQQLGGPTPAGGPPLRTLRLEGVKLPTVGGVYRIVANAPEAQFPEILGTPNDLGYVAIVPRTSKGAVHVAEALNIEVNVTSKLEQLVKTRNELNLTFVPMSTASRGNLAAPGRVPYSGAYLIERAARSAGRQ